MVLDWWELTPERRRQLEVVLERVGRWEDEEDESDEEEPVVVEPPSTSLKTSSFRYLHPSN